MHEREIIREWRALFSANDNSPETFAKAELLLDGISGESPLLFRLGSELEELKNGGPPAKKKRAPRRQPI